ncbi:MAG TPA: hypothetical protein VEJ18_13795, partial [Planctomycetota bacterium]|nr:hypothetical protein [Planctomycetota bacterium]
MAFLLYVPAAVAQDTSPPLPGSVLDGPGADADWQNHTISLSANWSGFSDPQSGVAGYRWAIGTAPGTADILPFTDVGTATNAAVFGLTLAEGATYYVTVEAANPDGYSVTATSDGVRIDTIPPPVPSLVSPPDSSTESTSGGVSFSWSVAAGASTYRFQLSTSSGFASPLLADIVLATTNTTTAALPTDTYFWRVVATDAAGNSSPASTVYSFTTTGSSVGSLSAAIGPASPFPSNELRGAVNLPVLQLRLSASAAEDIQLTALTISAQGTLDDPLHIREVRVWLDADSNGTLDSAVDLLLGGPRTYLADQGSITFPALGLLLPAGQSRDVLVVYGLNDTSPLGATFSARVASATHVEARGVTSNQALVPQGTFPLDGPTITIVASGSPGGLTVRLGSRTPGDGFIAAGEQTVEMAQIHLAASSVEDVRITGLVVHATGTADDAAGAAAVYVARDADENGILNVGVDTLLGTGTYVLDDGALGISFSTPLVLPKGRSASLLVVYDLSSTPSVGETFSLDVKPSEVAADGVDSGAQVTPSGLDFSASVKTVGTAGTTPVTLQISGRTLARGEPLWPASRDIPALAFDLKVGGLEGVGVQL